MLDVRRRQDLPNPVSWKPNAFPIYLTTHKRSIRNAHLYRVPLSSQLTLHDL